MSIHSEHLEILKSKSDEELITLFNNEINLKKDIDGFVKQSKNIELNELNRLMISEYRKSINEFIESNTNHKQYTWSVALERIRKNILLI